MPGSHSQQINEIVGLMIFLKPMSILDVGVGFGKYGVLAREYLDLWEGEGKNREAYCQWQRRVDGVEAYAGYLTPLHDFIYNKIYVGEAASVLPTITHKYDLVLLIDVIEHLNHDRGLELLRELERVGRNVLISTPNRVGHQTALYGNEFENHVSQWTEKHFRVFAPCVFIPNEASLICFVGDDLGPVQAFLRQQNKNLWKKSLKSVFPTLARLHAQLKKIVRHKEKQ